eukprot:Hpha_TRINITY_DN31401_c0_g1::TRINITY_DN31401_c0_g1_i1::g.145371::m.145371
MPEGESQPPSFFEDSRGLHRVNEAGKKEWVRPEELRKMQEEVETALLEYRGLIQEQKQENDVVQRRLDRTLYWGGAAATTSAVSTVYAGYQLWKATTADLSSHLFNLRPFRRGGEPTLHPAGFRFPFSNSFLLRLLQTRPVVGILCAGVAGRAGWANWVYWQALKDRKCREVEHLREYEQESWQLGELSNNFERVRNTYAAYSKA